MPKDPKDDSGRFTVTPPPSKFPSAFPEEGTPVVTNEQLAWREISNISKNISGLVRATNNQARYVKQIPEIKMDVKRARDEAAQAHQTVNLIDTKLSTELKNMDRRVVRVEDRAHDCSQVAIITELRETSLDTRRKVEEGRRDDARTEERLASAQNGLDEVGSRLEAFMRARRGLFVALLSLLVFGLSSVGSLVWFLSGINAEVEAEQRERRESYKRLEDRLEKVGEAADTASVRRDIETLTKVVEEVWEDEAAERFCAALSESAVRVVKRTVPRKKWPACRRFGGKVQ